MANRFCTACGAPLEDGAAHCGNCGAIVESEASQPQQAAQTSSWADLKQATGQSQPGGQEQAQQGATQAQPVAAQAYRQSYSAMGQAVGASSQLVEPQGPNKKLVVGIGVSVAVVIFVILFMVLGNPGAKGGGAASPSLASSSSSVVAGPPVFTSIQVSSQLPGDSDTVDYGARNLTDDIIETAWNEGANGDGTGERITMSASTPQHVTSVSIMGGFPRYYKDGSDVYFKNNRPQNITISYDSGFQSFTMQDLRGQFQTFTLAQPVDTKQLVITIDSVYKGTRYDECCIAEVKVQ